MPSDSTTGYCPSECSSDGDGSFYTAHETSFDVILADIDNPPVAPPSIVLLQLQCSQNRNCQLETQLSDACKAQQDAAARISQLEWAVEAECGNAQELQKTLQAEKGLRNRHTALLDEAKRALQDQQADAPSTRRHNVLLRDKVTVQSSLIDQAVGMYRHAEEVNAELKTKGIKRSEAYSEICLKLKGVQGKMAMDIDTIYRDAACIVKDRQQRENKSAWAHLALMTAKTRQYNGKSASTTTPLRPSVQKHSRKTMGAKAPVIGPNGGRESTKVDAKVSGSTASNAKLFKTPVSRPKVVVSTNAPARHLMRNQQVRRPFVLLDTSTRGKSNVNQKSFQPSDIQKDNTFRTAKPAIKSSPAANIDHPMYAPAGQLAWEHLLQKPQVPLGTPSRISATARRPSAKSKIEDSVKGTDARISSTPILRPSERLKAKTFGTPLNQVIRN